ncbi:MAG: HEAT repeat domain-containing protein [Phycisphaerales bacterium]|nr:MAG: HEAT repeat domain-containing protein [Phycisphaerales bacterium]
MRYDERLMRVLVVGATCLAGSHSAAASGRAGGPGGRPGDHLGPAGPIQDPVAHLSGGRTDAQDAGQVEAFRQVITSAEATAETRRVSARFLLMSTDDAAIATAVEILRDASKPHAQTAICEAAIELGAASPEALGVELVDPLVAILRSAHEPQQRLAAQVLGLYRDGNVAARLGAVAQDAAVAESARLAAIGALSMNMTRREVVEQLILLLDDPTPSVVNRALDVLQPASREPLGRDAAKWKAWWQSKAALSENEWLADRNALLLKREAALKQHAERIESEARVKESRLTSRLVDVLRDLFRRLPPDERDGKLIAWLADDIAAVRLTAVELIMRPISEEARRPSAAVRTALHERLRDAIAEVRRGALEIFGAIADPADAEAVMALLKTEGDVATRQAAFDALGRLRNAAALPLLVQEIGDPAARPSCVRSAADAVTRLAGIAPLPDEASGSAVEPLKRRFASTPPEDAATRAALVGAMAELARPEFVDEYRAVVASSREAALLRPAVRGLAFIKDQPSVPAVRALLQSSDDALVRQRCVEMIAAAGGDDADLAALVRSAQSANEPAAAVRDAALHALTGWVLSRSSEEQLRLADQLAADPAAVEAYLTLLTHRLSQGGGDGVALLAAQRRLGDVLAAAGKHAAAAVQYRAAFDTLRGSGAAAAVQIAPLLVVTSLQAADYETLGAVVDALRPMAADRAFDDLAEQVQTYLDSIDAAAEPARVAAVRKAILAVPRDGLGERWNVMAATLEKEHADQPPTGPQAPSDPGGDASP